MAPIRSSPRTGLPAVAVVLVLAAACAAPPEDPPAATTAPGATAAAVIAPEDMSPERLEPLLGFGPCDPPAVQPVEAEVDIPLPPTAIVADIQDQGAIVQYQGYVERTPVESMVALLDVDGWETLQAEDEVFEAEVLLSRDNQRLFFKTQAVCERGAAFVAVLGTDAPVPTPSQGGNQG